MIDPISLSGGVDLMTVKPAVKPGTLRDCLNYEVGTREGYSRIDGITRFDGRPSPASTKLWRLTLPNASSSNWNGGDRFSFVVSSSVGGYVLEVDTGPNGLVLYVVVAEACPSPDLPDQIHNNTIGGTDNVTIRDVVFTPRGMQATLNAALAAIYEDRKATIEQVPGQVGSDIIGHFFFRDSAYAIRDLLRVSYSGGTYTDANEGQYVTLSGSVYKILNVRQTGFQSGILTLDPVAGGVANATPFGTPSLLGLTITGSFVDGYETLPYSDGLTATGIGPYLWELAGDDAGNAIDLAIVDFNDIVFTAQKTDAAIYKSTSTGWERVALGREMAFRSGAAALENFSRDLTVTGYSGSIVDKFANYGVLNISGSPDFSVISDDGVGLPLSGANGDTIAFVFDMSSIPDGAIITGVKVKLERYSDVGAEAQDALVDLQLPSGSSNNKAKYGSWPAAPTVVEYGGDSDLWGSQEITPDQLKSPAFYVRMIVKRANPANPTSGEIDYAQISVYYQVQDAPAYVWNGVTDVPVIIRHIQVVSGDTTTGNATGWLTIEAAANAAKPRLICEGDQIRTGAAGTGTLLAIAAARDVPIWLPGQTEIDNNRSRYKFQQTNFYGRDEFDAIYGVSGAGVAFCFDGVRCIRIHTELPAVQDIPRHITRHGESLAIGYFSGAVLFSAVGDPFEMRGANGAVSIETGDRMTALRPLAGDALAVVCQSSTYLIRGTTTDTFFKSVLSSTRGGIEYTDADLGRAVICDGQGLFAADSAESFGTTARNYLSSMVMPWLRPRLQAIITSEQAYIRPIVALNVRTKNQYRLYFWDGSVLTMTNSEPPQFTFQRMFTPSESEHVDDVPWRVRAVSSGIDSSGRERLFVSFYGSVKEGYLFEMDVGRTFDSDPIPAFIELNPLDSRNASAGKKYDRLFMYGVGGGNATISASRASGYRHPNPDIGFQMIMGLADPDPATGLYGAEAVGEPEPFKGSVDAGIEGDDVSWRFDHNSASEAAFTLQAVHLYQDQRGQGRGTVR